MTLGESVIRSRGAMCSNLMTLKTAFAAKRQINFSCRQRDKYHTHFRKSALKLEMNRVKGVSEHIGSQDFQFSTSKD